MPSASFINKGVSGNKLTDVISRFNSDVTPNNPTHVWLMCGTNDWNAGVTLNDFTWQVKEFESLCLSNNYSCVMYNNSVAPDSDLNSTWPLSRAYANLAHYLPRVLNIDLLRVIPYT